jgi:hypothetical protein
MRSTRHAKMPAFHRTSPSASSAAARAASGFSMKRATARAPSGPLPSASPTRMYPYPVSGRVGGTPIVTRRSVASATSSARASVARNAGASPIAWSAGTTTMDAPGDVFAMASAASAIAAAVFRPSGSTSTWPRGSPCASRRTAAAWLAAVTTQVRRLGTSGRMRVSVSASRLRRPAIGSNCFGTRRRLRGQKRVPDPPAITTA